MLMPVSTSEGAMELWDNEAGTPAHVVIDGRLAQLTQS